MNRFKGNFDVFLNEGMTSWQKLGPFLHIFSQIVFRKIKKKLLVRHKLSWKSKFSHFYHPLIPPFQNNIKLFFKTAKEITLIFNTQNWYAKTEVMLKCQTMSKRFFSSWPFLQKTNEGILLYYYETSGRLVFVRFLEEIEDTKKTFRHKLTFSTWIERKQWL